MRIEYKIVVRKPENKTQIGRVGYRWKDNIKMDFREIGCESVD
jgi:hypothetical protein